MVTHTFQLQHSKSWADHLSSRVIRWVKPIQHYRHMHKKPTILPTEGYSRGKPARTKDASLHVVIGQSTKIKVKSGQATKEIRGLL